MITRSTALQRLGLDDGASLEQIRKAYLRLAKTHHPDVRPGDRQAAAKFIDIQEAYDLLRQPQPERSAAAPERAQRAPRNPQDDFFSTFYRTAQQARPRQGRSKNARGGHRQQVVRLTISNLLKGGTLVFKRQVVQLCPDCQGKTRNRGCRQCDWTGFDMSRLFARQEFVPCPYCRQKTCRTCHGQRQVEKEEQIRVPFPAGMTPGQQLAWRSGLEGGLIEIAVKPQARWRLEGRDLHHVLHLGDRKLRQGGPHQVKRPDGRAFRVRLPGQAEGQVIRLKGLGLPGHGAEAAGDLLLTLRRQRRQAKKN